MLLELDANLLKELDIPQFGKRLRIAQGITELRRPTSIASIQAEPTIPIIGSSAMTSRGVSAPPGSFGQPATTPPITTPTTPSSDGVNHSVWSHSRKTSSTPVSLAPLDAIREREPQFAIPPALTASTNSTSQPTSPVTPTSTPKRDSTGSLGHRKGKPTLDKQERLSFFGRARKPAPR